MVNRHNNQNNYNRRNTAILNVNQKRNKRKTLKMNNNNYNLRTSIMKGSNEFKIAFPPTRIRDFSQQSTLGSEEPSLGWMGSNNETRNNAGKGPSSVAHDLQALPTDPLEPEPVPLKNLQPMNNNKGTKAARQNTIFAHNLRGLAPRKTKGQSRVPWYAQTTAASRARVKATDAPGRQKAMNEHYKKIGSAPRKAGGQTLSGMTRRNKKSRKHKQMNNSVLPQNSIIRNALGRNVTKKNVSRWTPQVKKNEPSFYNTYLKNPFSSLMGSNSEVNNTNASTVVSEPEAISIVNSSSNNNSVQGGEYEKLIRRFKTNSSNGSFGSFATRSLKRGGRRTRRRRRSVRRTHRKSRRSNRK